MSTLIICAQDISCISFGLLEDAHIVVEKTCQSEPEGYMQALHQTLKEWSVPLERISALCVVTGPGAFTASRVSVVMANTIAFARDLPLSALENPEQVPLRDLIEKKGIPPSKKGVFAQPIYNRPPTITHPV